MIGLHFRIDGNHYGLSCDEIVEIIPRIPLRPIVGAPEYVPGFFNYRGKVVPIVDISRLAAGKETAPLLSSRIAIVHYGAERFLGLLLEDATAIVELGAAPPVTQSTGVKTQVPYLDGIIIAAGEAPLQMLKTAELLPEEVRKTVFAEAV